MVEKTFEKTEAEALKAPTTAEAIDKWFVESFHGSVVAHDTETFNYVRRAVDELKKRIA